ncbi:hypothetical protein HOD75_00105 [archaeon]|jgi:hypothetical protein|nr:hypothetical protein [Candidatus Woesearchaeota archaeon]MBT4136054.1 hypothetical protein [archaeon]MBT4241279.1 hypothetical protein [archaeon]MBT4418101.1 hypothetical protein [archaeon]
MEEEINPEEKIIEEVEEDVLDEIFVDKNIPMNKQLLVDILKPFITIDNEGVINFTEDYDKLKDNQKVLIYLASKKAKVAKEILEKDEEAAGPKEISENAGIGLSSAKVTVSQGFKKFLTKVAGGYIIPNYNLRKIKEIILKNGN